MARKLNTLRVTLLNRGNEQLTNRDPHAMATVVYSKLRGPSVKLPVIRRRLAVDTDFDTLLELPQPVKIIHAD